MGIARYIKEIGRGKDGARDLTREQAADLFGQVLDGGLSDLEVGAFCLAMRIKGETAQEMAGFLDATHQRLARVPAGPRPLVVLPSYNGARRLPLLTPLLALLLARQGLAVLMHGSATESTRIFTSAVCTALDIPVATALQPIAGGSVAFVPTALLSGGLQTLLDVRRTVGLRNSAHSLVKLMNPGAGSSLIIASYTHPQYARLMADTFTLLRADALLLRGTEGEPVADARRTPRMEGFRAGQRVLVEEGQPGALVALPELPAGTDPVATGRYIQAVLAGDMALPAPIARQVALITHLLEATP